MVTQFNKTDLVQFAKFVLEANKKRETNDGFKNEVTHANIENWLELKKNRGNIPVLAKFVVQNVERQEQSENTTIYLEPVYDGSEENKSFSKYTPSGQIMLNVSDETDASDYFEQDKEYFVKFTKA